MTTMTESRLRFAALAAILLCVSGCGLKGNLYIPEKEPANQAQFDPLPAPEAADEADTDEEQNDNETTGN